MIIGGLLFHTKNIQWNLSIADTAESVMISAVSTFQGSFYTQLISQAICYAIPMRFLLIILPISDLCTHMQYCKIIAILDEIKCKPLKHHHRFEALRVNRQGCGMSVHYLEINNS